MAPKKSKKEPEEDEDDDDSFGSWGSQKDGDGDAAEDFGSDASSAPESGDGEGTESKPAEKNSDEQSDPGDDAAEDLRAAAASDADAAATAEPAEPQTPAVAAAEAGDSAGAPTGEDSGLTSGILADRKRPSQINTQDSGDGSPLASPGRSGLASARSRVSFSQAPDESRVFDPSVAIDASLSASISTLVPAVSPDGTPRGVLKDSEEEAPKGCCRRCGRRCCAPIKRFGARCCEPAVRCRRRCGLRVSRFCEPWARRCAPCMRGCKRLARCLLYVCWPLLCILGCLCAPCLKIWRCLCPCCVPKKKDPLAVLEEGLDSATGLDSARVSEPGSARDPGSARGGIDTSRSGISLATSAADKSSRDEDLDALPKRSALKRKNQFENVRIPGRSPRSPRGGGRSPRSPRAGGGSPRGGSPRGSPGGGSPRSSPRGKGKGGRKMRKQMQESPGKIKSKSPAMSDGMSPRNAKKGRRRRKGDDSGRSAGGTTRRSDSSRKPTSTPGRATPATTTAGEHSEIKGRRKYHPSRWRLLFEEWKENREFRMAEVMDLVDIVMEEQEFDWDNLDDDGNPTQASHLIPKPMRRYYEFFMMWYWDPFLDFLEHLPSIFVVLRLVMQILPMVGFLGSTGWLLSSVWYNSLFVEGSCTIDALPDSYEKAGEFGSAVVGEYVVRRAFHATADALADEVFQECRVEVTCQQMDYGDVDSPEDDRCVSFRSWAWGQSIDCFYHQDDLDGSKGMQLWCVNRPSTLERETFTTITSSSLLFLALVIFGILALRNRELERKAKFQQQAVDKEQAEIEEAKKQIEDRELMEAKKALEAEHGDESNGSSDDDDDEDDPFHEHEGDETLALEDGA